MKTIGGYFELECEPSLITNHFPQDDGLLLNSGTNSFEYILRILGDIKRVYLPYYICDSLIEPLKIMY